MTINLICGYSLAVIAVCMALAAIVGLIWFTRVMIQETRNK